MDKKSSAGQTLMRDIPRGVASRRISDQVAPQSRFLDPEDIVDFPGLAYNPKDPGAKIMLGAIGEHLVGIDDNRHILTVAGSRAGKSVTVIGNLFFYQGSVLCTDPKGELAQISASKRAELGQSVYLLDPFEIVTGDAAKHRASFNPMRRLTLDNPYLIEDALQIIDALIVTTGDEKDPHWNESAGSFILGVILFVALSSTIAEEERNLVTVRKIINRVLDHRIEDKTVTFVFEQDAIMCAEQLVNSGHRDFADTMLSAVKGFYDIGSEERGSVLSTARRNTQFLEFRSMKSVLRGHDFDLEDLKKDPQGISVYLVLPATRMSSCNRWLRLFVNQLFDAMERERTVPKVPVLTVLDEFPVLGFMKQLQDAAGQIASFGVRLWVIMQDWGQGKALYGERFESFAANAGIFQCFGNVDVTTTEYISKRLGHTLVTDTKLGETSESQRSSGIIGEQESRQQFPLLTPDEVSRYFSRSDPQKRQLVFWAGYNPMILQRVEYYSSTLI
tara:strand:+ start:10089 stop:11597 length:1509 start_codon:yes stop_codon:yes gene_type:complete